MSSDPNDNEAATEEFPDLCLLSEAALAVDWLRPEEDEAWAYLADLANEPPK